MSPAMAVVVANIEQLRQGHGMSVAELARQTDVPPSTLRGWLSGSNMPVEELWAIARALGVSSSTLVEGV